MTSLEQLQGGLVVSCQPVTGGAMDRTDIVVAMALAAIDGGANGLRIEGARNVATVRMATDKPIIGLVKHEVDRTDVRITSRLSDVEALVHAGADIIAYDATDRPRQDDRDVVLHAILAHGCIAMADCSTFDDAQQALNQGAQMLGSTLSGYTAKTESASDRPDLALVSALNRLDAFVMAEGRYNSPDLAAEAFIAGADAVTVGSAITRVEHIVGWFKTAIDEATRAEEHDNVLSS